MMSKRLRKLVFNNMLLFILIIFSKCESNIKEPYKKKLTLFEIAIDNNSSPAFVQEKDSGMQGIIVRKGNDTILFHFGYDIDNLAEKDPFVVVFPYRTDTINFDTSIVSPKDVRFTNKPNFDIDEFRKQNVFFDTIDGYKAKITLPREIKNGGITGVYIDSLRNDSGGRLKFNLYGKNLDSLQSESLLKAIRSIQFNLKQ